MHSLRLALRRLGKSPGFFVAAVTCLALGMGANAAVFSLAKALLFQALPVPESAGLVRVFATRDGAVGLGIFSRPDVEDLAARLTVFASLAAAAPRPFHLSAGGENERLWGELTSASYFSTLRLPMAAGRGFLPEEDRVPGERPVVVLSHALWRERFASDPAIVGRSILLNGHPFTVVGVAAAGFHGSNTGLDSALWVPLAMLPVVDPAMGHALDERGSSWLFPVFARLKAGVTLAEAQAALDLTMAQLAREHPATHAGKGARAFPAAAGGLHPMVRGGFAGFLALMAVLVALVLLLACSNVAGLLLARAAGRGREIGVRLALGASRGQLLRLLLAESLLLALAAGAAGLLLAEALTSGLTAVPLPIGARFSLTVPLDGSLFAFALLLSLATALAVGLTPALAASRPDLARVLSAALTPGRRAVRLRKLAVGVQVALSLALLVAAGFAAQSLRDGRHIPLGFEPEGRVVANLDLDLQGYSAAAAETFREALEAKVRALPGFRSLAWADAVPLTFNRKEMRFLPEGVTPQSGSEGPAIDFGLAGPGYFATMGMPLLQGRGFAPEDAAGPPVAVVNRAFAERFFPGEEALGKRLRSAGSERVVVGVVATAKVATLGEAPRPFVYLPFIRGMRGNRILHLRAEGDPTLLLEPLRRAILELDGNLPVASVELLSERIAAVELPAKIAAVVMGGFALVALLLAAVGLYALIAQWVAERVPEIGIRMALGAASGDVIRLVVGQSSAVLLAGLLSGAALGAFLAALASRVLSGVDPRAPGVYLAAAALLLAVALAASLLPARRAARTPPAAAFRARA